MKINQLTRAGVVLIMGIVIIASCTKKYDTDYTPYQPGEYTESSINLTYDSPMETHPENGTIVTDTPSFQITGDYKFSLDTVLASEGASFNYNSFSINAVSGVIAYNNSNGTISNGSFTVDVVVSHIYGATIIPNAFELVVLEVPINVTADPDYVSTLALETGVISQLSYQVIGDPDPPLSDVSYTIDPPVTGFSVNEEGEVIKAAMTELGEYTLSVRVSTNYGDRLFEDLLTVEVGGSAPTLSYVQQDGTTPLTRVTVSPWSAYASAPPELEGMTADSWELILPEGAPQELAAGLGIESDGSISLSVDNNIPNGDYAIGVKAYSAGVPFDFEDRFQIHVETRWDETPVLTETFDYAVEGGAPLEEPFSSTTVNDGVPEKKFNGVNFVKDDPFRDIHAARLLYGKDGSYDVTMVLKLTNDGTWRNLRVKFSEFYGYGTVALEFFERTLWYAHVNETENGTFTPANWTQVMANDDTDWLTENLWGVADPFADGDLPSSPYKSLAGLDPAQSDIFICWRYYTPGNDDKGAQWFIDDVNVQAARAYPAEEE